MPDSSGSATRWYWNLPYIAVGVFALAMLAIVWVLQRQEVDVERNSMTRDMHWAEQTMRMHMESSQEFLLLLARDLGEGSLTRGAFQVRST